MARTPSPPLTKIAEALELASAHLLRPMLGLMPNPVPPPRRKVDMMAAVEARLSGDSLRELWNALDETQQLAVREALDTPHGFFDIEYFALKYDRLPAGFEDDGGLSTATLLHFFLYAPRRRGAPPHIVPLELANRLRSFVPAPPAAEVAGQEDLPEGATLIRRDMEQPAQHDLLAVLRLVDTGRVGVSAGKRQPGNTACERVAQVLAGGDFFDKNVVRVLRPVATLAHIRAFAWPCLLQAAKLVELSGSKLTLTKSGRTALHAPAPPTLRKIWKRWIGNTLLDEFNRVHGIKGQNHRKGRRTMTTPSGRRSAVADALTACPPGRWVRFDDFSRFVLVAGFDFEVNHEPWNLYIGDPRFGHLGYNRLQEWPIIEGRYMLCLLFEYAATLGLIDIAYTEPSGARPDFEHPWGAEDAPFLSRYDGLRYFRLNPLGAYCLDMAKAYEASTPSPQTALTVYPDLSIHATSKLSSDERLLLETYAVETDGVWRLDRDQTLGAIEGGRDPDELLKFLVARDDQPVPETVVGFLNAATRGARALKLRRPALLIECADTEIADRLTTDKHTAKLCLRAGERILAVPTASEAAFRKAARAMGYGMPR